jgi:hypothetical protein
MAPFNRHARARNLFLPDMDCLARRARCSLSHGYVSLRPCHVRRRPIGLAKDPLDRLLGFARALAARLWSLID